MGHSSSKNPSEKDLFKSYERSLHKVRHRHSKAYEIPLTWKKYLLNNLSSSAFESTPNWEIFEKAIGDWVHKKKYDENPSWLGNARFIAFQAENSSLLIKRTQSLVTVDLNELVRTKRVLTDQQSKSAGPSLVFDHKFNNDDSYFTATKHISASEELKTFLRKELNLPNHPVRELVNIFRKTYETLADGFEEASLTQTTNESELEEIYQQAIAPVKNILILLQGFIELIYSEMISSFEKKLNAEDKYNQLIIDHLLSQLIFDDVNSSIYHCIFHCLKLKNRTKIDSYQSIIETYRSKTIKELDSQMREKLTLSRASSPYENVISTIRLSGRLANPYMKRDYLSTLEEEMAIAINEYYETRGEHNEHVNLEPDDKFAIYTYCLIQSGYTNIILDTAFIEEFAIHEENNQSYARFEGCLKDYILSGEMQKFLSASH